MARRCAGVGALLLVGLAIPASANAAVIFGSDLTLAPIPPPAPECLGPGTGPCTDVALAVHDGNQFDAQAPVSGVVTSVRYRSNTTDTATLRLARLNGQNQAMGVGTGPTAVLNPSGAITEVPVNPGLPIQAGDFLAGDGTTATTFNCDPGTGASFQIYVPPLTDGGAFRAPSNTSNCEILVQGTIEPDADGDRLGDESQDNCTGLANPDTTNTDGDALGDACDPDDDNDAVADTADNCPLAANSSQSDVDGDALGDACDLIDNRPIDGVVPTAVLGRLLVARTLSGTVTIAFPAGFTPAGRARASQKGLTFVPLEQVTEIPVGSFLNTRRGTVGLTSAVNTAGKTQSGRFSRGLFQVLQSSRRSARGLTELRLKGSSFRSCRTRGSGRSASAAQLSRRTVRRLRSNARGRFRTRGRNSAATVRGTVWETIDRCDGTLTRVTRGRVAVRDFRRRKTVIVRAGKRYLAQARR
jgi:Thrombospondin type 3 repeat